MTPSEAIEVLRATLGLTEVAIAAAVGSTQPTINRIRRGVLQPNYELGKALVDLAADGLRAANEEDPGPSRCPEAA